jgi:hypothetical protein
MNKQRVYLFWGVMDLLYVWGFIYWNLSHGGLSLGNLTLIYVLLNSLQDWGVLVLRFVGPLLLSLSIFLTMFMFFRQSPKVRLIACLQVPFRLYYFTSSLSLITWAVILFGLKKSAVIFFVLLCIEILKLVSLYKADERQAEGV